MRKVTFDNLVFRSYAKDKIERSRYGFGDYQLSVIKEPEKNFYEVAIFDKDLNFVQLPGIHRTPENEDDHVDDVIPYLTPEEVTGIMVKLQSIQLAKDS